MQKVISKESASSAKTAELTKMLLTCGVVVGPLFWVVAVFQMFIRPGFDIRRLAISVLSLGNLGWIQIANFIVTGLLAILGAIGMKRFLGQNRGGTWGPLLVGAYGVGLIIGGLFHPDPGLGFPPGAPAGMPTSMSGHAAVHMFAFMLAFISLIVNSFVFARRFMTVQARGWATYCAATGVLTIVLIALGFVTPSLVGLIFAIAGAIAFGWVSVIASQLITELPE